MSKLSEAKHHIEVKVDIEDSARNPESDEMEFEKLPDPERFLTCRAVKEAYRIYTMKRNLRIARYINLEFSMK